MKLNDEPTSKATDSTAFDQTRTWDLIDEALNESNMVDVMDQKLASLVESQMEDPMAGSELMSLDMRTNEE